MTPSTDPDDKVLLLDLDGTVADIEARAQLIKQRDQNANVVPFRRSVPSNTGRYRWYLDPAGSCGGDDRNSGLEQAAPLKTWEEFCGRIWAMPAEDHVVYLLSDGAYLQAPKGFPGHITVDGSLASKMLTFPGITIGGG